MNKRAGFSLFFIVGLFCFSTMVSAYSGATEMLRSGVDGAIEIIKSSAPVFQVVIGDYDTGHFFFAKVLLLILLFLIINLTLRKAKIFGEDNNKAIIIIISAIVSILAVRFMNENQLIDGILLPYGAMGTTILMFLPGFLVYLALHFGGIGGMGRRIGWALFIVVFSVFWFSRYSVVQPSPIVEQIYWWGLLVMLLLFAFDKQIHNYFNYWELSAFKKGATQKTIASLQAEYMNILNVFTPQAHARRKYIENQLRAWGANIP